MYSVYNNRHKSKGAEGSISCSAFFYGMTRPVLCKFLLEVDTGRSWGEGANELHRSSLPPLLLLKHKSIRSRMPACPDRDSSDNGVRTRNESGLFCFQEGYSRVLQIPSKGCMQKRKRFSLL